MDGDPIGDLLRGLALIAGYVVLCIVILGGRA